MKKIMMVAMATVGMGMGAAVSAAEAAPEQGFYVGGLYSFVNLDFDEIDETIEPKALALQAGWNFSKFLAVEGRLGFDAGSDEIAGIDVKVENYFSGLLRGTVPFNDTFSVYGLIGFTSGKLEVSDADESVSDTDSGFSYGVGAEMTFAGRHGISLEWARLIPGDGYDADAVSVGYRYRF